MPKLDRKTAKSVDNAEAMAGFDILPEGKYCATLSSVEEREGQQYPYWVWEFTDLVGEDGKKYPGRMWNNTSLSPKSQGFLKATFEAFGVTPDTDTDDLIGEKVCLYLITETITKGSKIGQLRNTVKFLAPFDENIWGDDDEDEDYEEEKKPRRKSSKKTAKAEDEEDFDAEDDDDFEED